MREGFRRDALACIALERIIANGIGCLQAFLQVAAFQCDIAI